MYKFSYVKNVASRAEVVTRELFHQIIDSERVRDICGRLAEAADTEEFRKLKSQLPAFCFHGWFDQGKRKNYCAHPSGLIMLDLDHLENPSKVWEKIEVKAKEMGLVLAHITPSRKGLRLVFPIPSGMDIIHAQIHYAKILNLKNIDACTKDLARLSFCVPEEYFLYVDEESLFEGEEYIPDISDVVAEEEIVETTDNEQVAKQKTIYENEYDGIPYYNIVNQLEMLMGGKPEHGSRNNFIFAMACYLRYICNDDADWIMQILPTYGENKVKYMATIRSACLRSQNKVMPTIMRRAIKLARTEQLATTDTDEQNSELPPLMPEKLPPIIDHLIKNVPEVTRPAVAVGVFPALAAHLKGTKFTLIDGTEKEPTFMTVCMAKMSSGKSSINKPVEYIIQDIVERDELSRQREQEWKDACNTRSANKEKPKRPNDLAVQVLTSDMTNAAFVQRMQDAGGRYLYTNLEELQLLNQLQTNGKQDVGKIICLCFDNGLYGQERVGTQSVTARVQLRWNWNASSTIAKGIDFFKNRLVDGTLSRVNFCTIIQDKSKPFQYGKYDEEYAEKLKPFITNLNLAAGHIECPEALELAIKMQQRCDEIADLSDDDVYRDLSYRAVTIAYLKAMVLYIANNMTWSQEIADFTQWSLDYDLYCKMHFFGDKVKTERQKEKVEKTRGRKNLLELLPDSFSTEDAAVIRKQQCMSENPRQMLNLWVFRGYVERDETGRYTKTDTYLSRKFQ